VRLTYYGYNAFVVEGEGKSVVLDPGQNLYWRRMDSLVPKARWHETDLILVTHGDADHAEYVVPLARASGAPVVCGRALARRWQRRGLTVVSIAPGEAVEVAGVRVRAILAEHGPRLRFLGRRLGLPFVGAGSLGLLITLEGHRLLNLGDTLLLDCEWQGLQADVLMVPIGGLMTMDVVAALRAIEIVSAPVVVPVHHNWHILFYRHPADVQRFADGVEKLGLRCVQVPVGGSFELPH
jgi:L-ascorbate metabolism protein UlaG (beta-lactamase superfamily)